METNVYDFVIKMCAISSKYGGILGLDVRRAHFYIFIDKAFVVQYSPKILREHLKILTENNN